MAGKRAEWWVLVLIPLLVYLAPLPFMPLMEPDEGRYSAIPGEMNASGDYITPHLKHAVYFEKPPLCYWATAVAFKALGENEFAARLFIALCAWGCILLVYRMGLYFHDRRTGLYAAALLSTCLFHAAIGRIQILDMPLAFFVCLAIWAGFRHFQPDRPGRWGLYGLYLASALAFLTKGLIGVVFPFGVLFFWLLFSRRWREIPGLLSPVGIALFLLLTLPWLILVQQANPDFFRFFFIQEHLLRYTTRIHDRYQPVYFYLPVLLAGTLPWCAYLPRVMQGCRKTAALFGSGETRFLLTWIGLILIFFSLSSSKLIPYIGPVFPPLALFLGHLFRNYEERRETQNREEGGTAWRNAPAFLPVILFVLVLLAPLLPGEEHIAWGRWWPWITAPFALQLLILWLPDRVARKTGRGWFATIYLLFALFLATVTFPVAQYVAPYKSAWAISQAVKAHLPAGELLYQYRMSLYGIDFYTGLRTPIVDDIGEVRYGSEQLPAAERERYFLTSDSFFKLIHERKAVYCATGKGERLERLKKEVPGLTLLWHNEDYALVKLTDSGKGSEP